MIFTRLARRLPQFPLHSCCLSYSSILLRERPTSLKSWSGQSGLCGSLVVRLIFYYIVGMVLLPPVPSVPILFRRSCTWRHKERRIKARPQEIRLRYQIHHQEAISVKKPNLEQAKYG
jgi:hypothetical protein